jgi:hypothetical protein
MGEIADMMIEGDMCPQCGEYLGTGNGFPTLCPACRGNSKPNKSNNEEE